jgi:hypothetical protein
VLAAILATAPEKARSNVLKAFKSMGPQSKIVLSGVNISKQIMDELEHCIAPGEFIKIPR